MGETEYILRIVLKARDEIAAVLAKARAELQAFAGDIDKHNTKLDALHNRLAKINQQSKGIADNFEAAGAKLQKFSSQGDDVDKTVRKNVESTGDWDSRLSGLEKVLGRVDNDLRKVEERLRSHSKNTRDADRDTNIFARSLKFLNTNTGEANNGLASLDNRLKGIAFAVAIGLSQQFATVLMALGAQLVAVASSAIMAGAAIGGIASAGLAQAVPAIGLLIGSLQRLKAVTDAFQSAQKLQQAAFVDSRREQAKSTDTTKALADAQEKLNEARRKGRRELQDLIDQERSAKLAQGDAAKALRIAVAEGNTADIERLQFQRDLTRRQAGRATADRQRVGGNVENLDSVKAAKKALDDATASAKETSAGITTAQANLDYLLSQLSPAEQKLFKSIQRIYKDYRKVFIGDGTGGSGIYGTIVNSFTRAVDRVDVLMNNSKIIGTVKRLAKGISEQIDEVTSFGTSPKMLDQLGRITDQATKNLPGITKLLETLFSAFLNIAEAGDKAFGRFLRYITGVAEKFLGLTNNKKGLEDFFVEGEKHLESWLNLTIAIIGLFAALMGAGGADSGKKSIDDLTKSINETTESVDKNREKIAEFFEKTRKDSVEVFKVFVNIGKALYNIYSSRSLQQLTDALSNILIPALETTIMFVGAITTAMLTFLNLPIVRNVAQFAISIALLGGFLKGLLGFVGMLLRPLLLFGGILVRLGAAFKAFGFLGTLARLFPVLTKVLLILRGAILMVGRALIGVIIANPWIAAILAIIAVVVLLDKKFHFLGPTFKWLKKAAMDVFNWVKDHWKLLLSILVGPIGAALIQIITHWKDIKRAFRNGINAVIDFMSSLPGRVGRFARNAADAIVDAFRGIGRKVLRGIVRGLSSVADFANDLGNAFIDILNKALPNKIDLPNPLGSVDLPNNPIPHLNKGGPVPGAGNTDSVSARLTPGEHVWTKREVANAGGHAVMYALRAYFGGGGQSAGGGYAVGGQVLPNAQPGGVNWGQAAESTRNYTSAIEARIRRFRLNISNTLNRLRRDSTEDFVGIEMSGKVHMGRLARYWEKTWKDVADTTYDGLHYIGHETNLALTGLGGKHINFGLSKPKAEKHAAGGFVGKQGQRGADSVLSWLAKGEAVLTHWQQAAVNAMLPGQMTLADVMGGVRGFQGGGPGQPGFADGKIVPIQNGEEINSKIYRMVMNLIRKYHLLITDAFDRDGSAGHKSPGHNVTGTAVDFVPGTGGSWKLLEAMGRWAVGKGFTVGYDANIPGAQQWPNHGRGHHIHVEFGKSGALAPSELGIGEIRTPKVRGAEGGLKSLMQAAIKSVAKEANDRVAGDGMIGDVSTLTSFKGGGSQSENISLGRKMAAAMGWTGKLWQALRTLWMGESGWDETADNPTSDAYGIPQSLPGSKMASKGKDWKTNAATQIAWGLDYIKDRYGDPLAALQAWQGRSPHWYAAGGEIPGGEGSAVPIVAHAGEWVLNKAQQLRAAALAGMDPASLRTLLGFGGSNKKGFAEGGEVKFDPVEGFKFPTSKSRSMKAVANFIKAVNRLTDEDDGYFVQMAARLTEFVERMAAKTKAVTYSLAGVVRKNLSEVQLQQRLLEDLERQTPIIQQMQAEANASLKEVQKQLKKKGLGRDKRQALRGQEARLQKILEELDTQFANNLEERFQQQIAAQQAVVDEINNRFSRASAHNDFNRRVATLFGNEGLIDYVNGYQLGLLEQQRNELNARISAARNAGAEELAQALEDQVADLGVQMIELVAQQLQDQIDRINTRATRGLGQLDLVGRMADALGQLGIGGVASAAGITASRGELFGRRNQILEQQRSELQLALNTAALQGNMKMVQDLTDQLAELDVTIAENTKAQFDAQFADINDQSGFSLNLNDLNKQVVELMGAISGNTDQTELLRLANQRQAILTQKQIELQALLEQARLDGNEQGIIDLTTALLENKIALLNNTQSMDELSGKSKQQTFTSSAWTMFREALFTGEGSLIPNARSPLNGPVSNGLAAPGFSTAPGGGGNTTIDIDVEVNQDDEPVDPLYIANKIGFVLEQSTP